MVKVSGVWQKTDFQFWNTTSLPKLKCNRVQFKIIRGKGVSYGDLERMSIKLLNKWSTE